MKWYLHSNPRQVFSQFALVIMLTGCNEGRIDSLRSCKNAVPEGTQRVVAGDSALLLVNGQETAQHAAVVLIVRNDAACTGTFVSDTTAITASHCLDESANGGVSFSPGEVPDPTKGVAAQKAFHFGYTKARAATATLADTAVRLDDLAVLVFPPGSAPGVVQIAERKPEPGETVTLVGFGRSHFLDEISSLPSVMRRRMGTNAVKSPPLGTIFPADQIYIGFMTQTESEQGNGNAALTSKGDSGGPIFLEGRIAGISASAGSSNEIPKKYFSKYTPLAGDKAQELFQLARAGGANIPQIGEVNSVSSGHENAGSVDGASASAPVASSVVDSPQTGRDSGSSSDKTQPPGDLESKVVPSAVPVSDNSKGAEPNIDNSEADKGCSENEN